MQQQQQLQQQLVFNTNKIPIIFNTKVCKKIKNHVGKNNIINREKLRQQQELWHVCCTIKIQQQKSNSKNFSSNTKINYNMLSHMFI